MLTSHIVRDISLLGSWAYVFGRSFHKPPILTGFEKKGFASKVDVAPKVAFLPQKSFHILIAFADYDYQPEFLSLFCAGR